ncbi:MAG: Bacterial Ig-like domain (group 2) [Armatimonadetes bacterium]|nr:Bacterial Ig-like domain (group 2) [Armatimonadota bacterium]
MRVSPKRLKDGNAEGYADWIVESIRKNVPYDRFARELLTSSGAAKDVAPANYFLAIPTTDERTEMTAQLFMGSRLECAKCHNHPFEAWTMRDYYSISAVFARTQADKGTVRLTATGEVQHPTTQETLRPWGTSAEQARASAPADRRAFFAEWLTKPGNPYFARVEVNRMWAELLGRGIVNPVDDFRSSNPPANVALLDALAREFETSGFDRKRIIRLICNSQTYQRSTETNRFNESDEALFSHGRVRLLTAEQLKDAIAVATRALPSMPEAAERPRYATQRPYPETSSFTTAFGQPQRDTACTCERQTSPTLLQALELLNGGAAYGLVQTGAGKYAGLENDTLIEELYLAALCRRPSEKERATARAYLARATKRDEAVADLVWTLVNTQEFLFQH